ncbi:MAG: hypothetical protein IPL71_02180 [Anaerolineales bacterium]|uniref:hypothetical protein n=1 Tax=Candidatus Villigracilis proximus TaxID=3140683 RepID=UPI003135C2E6|nr:hypothetical protein [Anaerolineales bacterium]
MKIRFNSIQKLAAVTFLFSLAGLLGACTPTTDLLGGAAGLELKQPQPSQPPRRLLKKPRPQPRSPIHWADHLRLKS